MISTDCAWYLSLLTSRVRSAVISGSDLSKITKKQIRQQLESKYATSLVAKKDFMNATIENILAEAV